MLYEAWRSVARACSSESALLDAGSGQRWTFADLDRESEKPAPDGPVVFPRGDAATFITAVLRAWREGRALCPLEADQPTPKLPSVPPEGIAHLKLTSATTGTPRMVAFTGAQLAADARNIVRTMGLKRDWPNLAVISLAHSYGFSNLVLPLLLHGIPMVAAWSPLPEAIRAAAKMGPAFTLPAVPALWRAWQAASSIPPTVRLAISAGAPLPAALERDIFSATGLKVHNFYGSSECGGIAYDTSESPRSNDSAVGCPMANVSLEISPGGCLVVRGDAVAQGYWPIPAPELGNGRFLTADLCEISGGQVRILGRATEQINVAGRKLFPDAIEAVLSLHPGVKACLAFGVPGQDAARGDVIVACVNAHATLSEAALRQFALERLPAWQVPREWWFSSELEPNVRGKLSRALWRERYTRQRHSTPG